MKQLTERPVLEALLETTEVAADVLMDGDIIASIPIIGTAIKACKAFDAVRDRLFAAKLQSFLLGLDRASAETKEKMRQKAIDSKEEAQKIGEVLLLTLEHITDLSKPLLLAQLFIAYIDGVLSSEDLRRLFHSIDQSFNDDLLRLLYMPSLPNESDEEWLGGLISSGLVRDVSAKYWLENGTRRFSPTSLSWKLREAYQHAISYGVRD